MDMRRAYSGYHAANLGPMIPLSLFATVAIYLTAALTDTWTLAPAWRLTPVVPLLFLAFLASRTRGALGLGAVALVSVLFAELAINVAGIGLVDGMTWATPGSLLLPVVTSVFWPTRWHFLAAMALTALCPLPMLLLKGDGLQLLQFAVYMAGAITLSSMMYAVMARTLRRQLQLEAQLRKQAAYDGLTGLLLRNRFFDLAQRVLNRSHAERQPVCVAYLDADHFKLLNDMYGHAAGDAALIGLADCLREHVRTNDLVGRVGGEEFTMLLPGIDLRAARARLEQVRQSVHSVQRPDGPLTLSIGIAQSCGPEEPIYALVARAENAMRQAKAAGRDRAVLDQTGR
jgi:diguanylate cyclase (GGDEF)-like protein